MRRRDFVAYVLLGILVGLAIIMLLNLVLRVIAS